MTILIESLIKEVKLHQGIIFDYAKVKGIDGLMLRSQLLLHLPRNDVHISTLSDELKAVANEIKDVHAGFDLEPFMTPVECDLNSLSFRPVDNYDAETIHRCFHYVSSYRPGLHFGLYAGDHLVCMGSVANCDLKDAMACIPWVDPAHIMVYSRFYAFPWAPKNCFSYFWKKLRQHLTKEYDIDLMFTWINPNIGFTGNSHFGASWQLFAYEEGTCYMYENGHYKTMRYFVQNYGTSNPTKLKRQLKYSFGYVNELHPLKLLAIPLNRRARKAIPKVPYLLTRPVL